MSSLWTPDGERRIPDHSSIEEPEVDEDMAARLDELRKELSQSPVDVVVANHAYGLFELAALHLSSPTPDFSKARLAVDAMACLVEGLEGRLGESEEGLRDALAQIRLAFVQISQANGDNGSTPPS